MKVVRMSVRPEHAADFVAATEANVAASRLESGVELFELVEDPGHPVRFVLVEVFRSADAAEEHKRTRHFLTWREAAEPMMTEPWRVVTYLRVAPSDRAVSGATQRYRLILAGFRWLRSAANRSGADAATGGA